MFQLYAAYESDGGKFITRKRAAALAHLHTRQAAGEKLRLIQLRVAPQDVNHVRVTFELTRYAPDFGKRQLHGRVANGAGTIDLRPPESRRLDRERPLGKPFFQLLALARFPARLLEEANIDPARI